MLMQTSLLTTPRHPAVAQMPGIALRPRNGADGLMDQMDLRGAPMAFSRNAEIYGENEPADYAYKVVSGSVRTYKIFDDGRRQIGAFIFLVTFLVLSSVRTISFPPRQSTNASSS